jgi:hypothetical protein
MITTSNSPVKGSGIPNQLLLTFFIAGLLYLVRFERVDSLGAYRIPSETGLLIPSDFSNRGVGILAFCMNRYGKAS